MYRTSLVMYQTSLVMYRTSHAMYRTSLAMHRTSLAMYRAPLQRQDGGASERPHGVRTPDRACGAKVPRAGPGRPTNNGQRCSGLGEHGALPILLGQALQ